MSKISDLHAKWMKDPDYRAEFESLEEEFNLAEAMIEARARHSLTQQQIVERMGTSQAAIARIESGKGNPSLKTLQRYAEATGSRLRIVFEREQASAAK